MAQVPAGADDGDRSDGVDVGAAATVRRTTESALTFAAPVTASARVVVAHRRTAARA
jgi:hypothetical protein